MRGWTRDWQPSAGWRACRSSPRATSGSPWLRSRSRDLEPGLVSAALSAEHGIGVRDGKFCAHLVDALLDDLHAAAPASAVRVSVGLGTTGEHVERLLAAWRSWPRRSRGGEYELGPEGWAPVRDERNWTDATQAGVAPRPPGGSGPGHPGEGMACGAWLGSPDPGGPGRVGLKGWPGVPVGSVWPERSAGRSGREAGWRLGRGDRGRRGRSGCLHRRTGRGQRGRSAGRGRCRCSWQKSCA